jgi:parallel beta-helix repeat protein
MQRLSESIPASCTIWKDGIIYRAECNIAGGTDYSNPNCSTLLGSILGPNLTITIREGDYPISHVAIPWNSNHLHLKGEGRARFTTSSDDYMFFVSHVDDVTFENLEFCGDGDPAKTLQCAITIFDTVKNVRIEGCRFENIGYDAINMLWDAVGCKVAFCSFYNMGDDAINPGGGGGAAYTVGTVVQGNYIKTCGGDGVHLSAMSKRSMVVGNYIEDCQEGIGIYDSTYNTITGNFLYNNVSGIKCLFGTTSHQVITGNIIQLTTGTVTNGCGITLAYDSDYSTVTGNLITETNNYGIWVLECEHNTVNGNTIIEAIQGIRFQDSQYGLIEGNHVIGNSIAAEYGIVVTGVAATHQYNSVIGNKIYGTIKFNGIFICNNRCFVSGNHVAGTVGSYAIQEDPGANYNRFEHNDMCDCTYQLLKQGAQSAYSGDFQQIEHHIADDILTIQESGSIHTNLGEDGAMKLTLPQTAKAGVWFEFVVMTAQAFQIDPGAVGAIYINGAKLVDDKYIWADDEGESVKLVADGNGDWIAIGAVGTWTSE